MPDPGVTVWLEGELESEKSGEEDVPMISVIGIWLVRLPLVAVSVNE